LKAARAAAFRLPFVLHARLGLVDAEDEHSVDAARIKVLEALDAGATSVQLGVFGDVESAARLLPDLLRPVVDNGLGVVIQLADSAQVDGLPPALGPLEVHAFASSSVSVVPRRDVIALRPVAPFPFWADASAVVMAAVKSLLKDLSPENIPEALRDRVELKVFAAVEDLLAAVKAKGSAGKAMVDLSQTEEAWPDPE
jgi:hypothetical protein